MKKILIKCFKALSPTYRVLDKSFFELNKRIDKLEQAIDSQKKVDYVLSKNDQSSQLAHQIFDLKIGQIQFKYNIFNFNDFQSIVNEIIKPNFYKDEKESTYYWQNLHFQNGDVAVDIGGNIGMFSIPFAKCFPHVRVLCFEPLQQNFEILKANVELNQLSNIEIYPFGVSGEAVKTNFVWKPFHNGGSGGLDLTSKGDVSAMLVDDMGEVTQVELIPFDSLFSDYGVKKIALLKMDCEGGEYDIMLNSSQFNSSRIAKIIGEVHEDTNSGDDFKKVNRILKEEFSGEFKLDCYTDLINKYNVIQ